MSFYKRAFCPMNTALSKAQQSDLNHQQSDLNRFVATKFTAILCILDLLLNILGSGRGMENKSKQLFQSL